jgi:hypothetical protein
MVDQVEVQVCTDCKAVYSGGIYKRVSLEKCPRCQGEIIKKRYLRRYEVERIVFVVLAGLLGFIGVVGAMGPNGEILYVPEGGTFTLRHWLGLLGVLIVTSYILGNYFLKIPRFSVVVDPDEVDDVRDLGRFRVIRFLREFLFMFVPFTAVSILVGIRSLFTR